MPTPHVSKKGWIIALDGGTTNTRARLIDAQGTIRLSVSRAVGVRNTALANSSENRTALLKEAVRSVVSEAVGTVQKQLQSDDEPIVPEAIVAAGMLSADVGLCMVPHVSAPAGLEELARSVRVVGIPEISEHPIHFIPGVKTFPGDGPDGWFEGDMMRGEETETMGAVELLKRRGILVGAPGSLPPAFIWPGSHTKLVDLDEQHRIVRSATSLAGELTQAVWSHTLLAASLPVDWPSTIDLDAADAGGRAADRHGLARAAFLVRIAAVAERMNENERASFWIGAVLAADASFLANHPILRDEPSRTVWIGGKQPLRGLLHRFLGRIHRGEILIVDDDVAEACSAIGARAIVLRSAESLANSRS